MGSASLGLQAAGIEVAAALDTDEHASTNYEMNVGIPPIVDDIRKVSGKSLLQHIGLSKGDCEIVVGCPPCQSFSSLKRTRCSTVHDARSTLVCAFADRIRELLPQAVIFENVPGILHPSFQRRFYWFVSRLESYGYAVEWRCLNCADYGIPQLRKRVIAVGIRSERNQVHLGELLPEPTHTNPVLASRSGLLPWRTVRETIEDLPPLLPGENDPAIPNHDSPPYRPSTMRIIKAIPKNGGSRRSLPSRLWLRCHKNLETGGRHGAASVYGRMWWDRPAPTITTRCTNPSSGRFIHPEEDRAITLREAMRLQTIPDKCHLRGPRSLLAAEVGNAVPTSLIEMLGTHLSSLLDNGV